jgi:hypothetical protein
MRILHQNRAWNSTEHIPDIPIRLGPFLRPDAPKGEMLHLSGFPDADADVLALSYRAEDVACRSGSTAWAFMGNGFASYSFPAARVASIP